VTLAVLEISPGLSNEPTTGTVNHIGPLGQENCYGGEPLGYKPTGPIGIEHYISRASLTPGDYTAHRLG